MSRRLYENPFALSDGLDYQVGSSSLSDEMPDMLQTGLNPSQWWRGSAGASSSVLRSSAIRYWFACIGIGILLLLGRALYLQVVATDHYRSVAEGNRLRIHDFKSRRGVMYDRNGVQLVENIPSFSLQIIPVDLPNDPVQRRALAQDLAPIAGQTPDALLAAFDVPPSYSAQPAILTETVTYDQAIQANILATRWPAVRVAAGSIRHYVGAGEPSAFAHVFGYESRIHEDEIERYLAQGYSFDDYIGRTGLEAQYETELKGKNGKEQVEVDATGKPKEIIARTEPTDGYSLELTIDAGLQQQAYASLAASLKANRANRGTAIAIDPRNGEILALVNLPSYDPNVFAHGIGSEDFSALLNDPNRPLFNRSISGEFPSGSTFKLIVAAAALQENVITPETGFLSTGGIRVGSWFFPDWKGGGHGWTVLSKALAESVNTFFYIVGGGYQNFTGLGVERLATYAKKFGLGEQLGIDLPGERTGLVPTPAWKKEQNRGIWYIGDTYHFAIGQGDLLVTPLQVAGWASVFANDGTLWQPHLVKAILDTDKNVVKTIAPTLVHDHIVDQHHIDAVAVGLREAVVSGSARALSGLPVTAAGKTGTAQWSLNGATHAWSIAYAPYPVGEIAIVVLIEEGGEGSTAAMPVIRDMLSWWAAHRDKTSLEATTTPVAQP